MPADAFAFDDMSPEARRWWETPVSSGAASAREPPRTGVWGR